MCTAAAYRTGSLYFGRTLDYDFSYGSSVVITPRSHVFKLRSGTVVNRHHALIGMATVMDDYPLYYEAMNEKGLCMAGLNFVGNAVYRSPKDGMLNLTQFELIPYILGTCGSVAEVRRAAEKLNVTDLAFSDGLPLAQLHWMIADGKETVILESTADGVFLYDDPAGVMTNNPPFPQQLLNLSDYQQLSPREPENRLSGALSFDRYSRGLGGVGLPGDLSSRSRFVRAAFVNLNSVSGDSEEESVNQFFHILGSVDQQRGCCELEPGKYEITLYTSCLSPKTATYYYTTYENHQISAVTLRNELADGDRLLVYPLVTGEKIFRQN